MSPRRGSSKCSRHEALEVLTVGHLWRDIELRNALTIGRGVFRSGPYQGYQLKNLPRLSTQTALSVPVQPNVMLTFAHSSTSRTCFDDENTTTIPGIHLFSTRNVPMVYSMGGRSIRVALEVER